MNPVGAANRPLIALTGATGFIGQCLLRELPKRGYRLRVLLRRPSVVPMDAASAVVGDLARPQNMAAALADVDAVIHSAGLAHAMSGLPEDDYRMLNTEATIGLARAAQRAGAKRFVFLSSIRAQAGATADHILTEDSRAATDGRLWPLEACGGTGPRGARPGLGRAAPRPRLRHRRERQHGGARTLRALALPATARPAPGQAVAAVARQPGGGNRCGAHDAGALATTVDRGGSQGADDSRNDCGATRRARPQARPHPDTAFRARDRAAGRQDGARFTSGSPARWWRTHPPFRGSAGRPR